MGCYYKAIDRHIKSNKFTTSYNIDSVTFFLFNGQVAELVRRSNHTTQVERLCRFAHQKAIDSQCIPIDKWLEENL